MGITEMRKQGKAGVCTSGATWGNHLHNSEVIGHLLLREGPTSTAGMAKICYVNKANSR